MWFVDKGRCRERKVDRSGKKGSEAAERREMGGRVVDVEREREIGMGRREAKQREREKWEGERKN